MIIGGNSGEMLVFNRKKLTHYTQLKSIICFISIIVSTMITICEAMAALGFIDAITELRAVLFCGDVIVCTCMVWLAIFHACQADYGYEWSSMSHTLTISFAVIGVCLTGLASIMQLDTFIECVSDAKVFQDIVFMTVVVVSTSVVGFMLWHTESLIRYWFVDHRLWQAYIVAFDINDKPIAFTEYCRMYCD